MKTFGKQFVAYFKNKRCIFTNKLKYFSRKILLN